MIKTHFSRERSVRAIKTRFAFFPAIRPFVGVCFVLFYFFIFRCSLTCEFANDNCQYNGRSSIQLNGAVFEFSEFTISKSGTIYGRKWKVLREWNGKNLTAHKCMGRRRIYGDFCDSIKRISICCVEVKSVRWFMFWIIDLDSRGFELIQYWNLEKMWINYHSIKSSFKSSSIICFYFAIFLSQNTIFLINQNYSLEILYIARLN